jgi:hypothetical protein
MIPGKLIKGTEARSWTCLGQCGRKSEGKKKTVKHGKTWQNTRLDSLKTFLDRRKREELWRERHESDRGQVKGIWRRMMTYKDLITRDGRLVTVLVGALEDDERADYGRAVNNKSCVPYISFK